jgi:hypothetical protein
VEPARDWIQVDLVPRPAMKFVIAGGLVRARGLDCYTEAACTELAFQGADCKGVLGMMAEYMASEAYHTAVPGNNRDRMSEEQSLVEAPCVDDIRHNAGAAFEGLPSEPVPSAGLAGAHLLVRGCGSPDGGS